MNKIPIDQRALALKWITVVPKTDMEGVQQRTSDKDRFPKWEVQCLCEGEALRRPEVLVVTLAAITPPQFAPMTPVEFEGLIARHWENDGRSGVAFSADGVRPLGKSDKPAAPSVNGTKESVSA